VNSSFGCPCFLLHTLSSREPQNIVLLECDEPPIEVQRIDHRVCLPRGFLGAIIRRMDLGDIKEQVLLRP
jgi:hypothetical protein